MQLDLGRFWRSSRFSWPAAAAATARARESGDGTEAACTKSALSGAPELPKGWPEIENVTYTQESQQGPTTVVEGYFDGDVKAAHDEFKRELERPGSRSCSTSSRTTTRRCPGKGRDDRAKWRSATSAAASDKVFVHITNRPG